MQRKRYSPKVNPVRAQAHSDLVLNAPWGERGHKLGQAVSTHLMSRVAVYAIGPQAGPPVKIGFSRKPGLRLATLQVSSPQELKLHLLCWTPTKADATKLEAHCHSILKKLGRHIRGEWFNLDAAAAAKVIDSASIDIDCRLVPHKQLMARFPLCDDPLAGCFWEAAA